MSDLHEMANFVRAQQATEQNIATELEKALQQRREFKQSGGFSPNQPTNYELYQQAGSMKLAAAL